MMAAELNPLKASRAIGLVEPIRVIHIVENLSGQAVESWLLRVAQAAGVTHANVHWTFFCVLGKQGELDQVAREIGADVIHSRYEVGDKVRFVRSLRNVMKAGNYDILHCHHDIMSAAYLAASAGLPFRKRIVHVHNTSLSLPTPSRVKSELVREPMRQLCLGMADQIVGVSRDALECMIGVRSLNPLRHRVIHCCIDTDRFSRCEIDRAAFRSDLQLSPTTRIMLFVGRLVDQKNPTFVLDVLERLVKIDSEVVAVFAGEGGQEVLLSEIATQKHLHNRIRILGFRDDVPTLMINSDLLIWPSLEKPKEGLGLGVVEAQAAGLPVLMSRSVPREAIVVPELVEVLPLAAGAERWANSVMSILSRPTPNREEAQRRVASSSFSMTAGVSSLVALYERV